MHQHAQSSGSCLARLVWFLAGPAVMVFLAILNVERGGGWLTSIDILYFVCLAVTIVARWMDTDSGSVETLAAAQASSVSFRKYALGALLIGAAVWAVANVVGNHWA